jgi:hypothetical protein
MEYLKYGLLLHLLSASFMLSNPVAFQSLDRSQGMKPLYNPEENIEGYEDYVDGAHEDSLAHNATQRMQYFHQ